MQPEDAQSFNVSFQNDTDYSAVEKFACAAITGILSKLMEEQDINNDSFSDTVAEQAIDIAWYMSQKLNRWKETEQESNLEELLQRFADGKLKFKLANMGIKGDNHE